MATDREFPEAILAQSHADPILLGDIKALNVDENSLMVSLNVCTLGVGDMMVSIDSNTLTIRGVSAENDRLGGVRRVSSVTNQSVSSSSYRLLSTMSLIGYTPFDRSLRRAFDHMFDDDFLTHRSLFPYWRNIPHDHSLNLGSALGEVENTSEKFAVSVDVSHFKPEEIKVNLNGNELTIEGDHEESRVPL
ncbi:hypothetical protein PRIPAC_81995, partial [Pristionchus pacificus]